jgi:hypothetical protein
MASRLPRRAQRRWRIALRIELQQGVGIIQTSRQPFQPDSRPLTVTTSGQLQLQLQLQ